MRLELKNIYKAFGEKQVLHDIQMLVESRQALGLLGRNGAGKTTAIRIIMGIFWQDSGEVLIDGVPNHKTNVKIGYLPEERGLYPKKTVIEQMVYMGEMKGMKAAEAKKASADLLEQLEAEQYLKKRLDTLSKGNQQKIQLAIALMNDPDIVILDEPFSGLDPVNAKLLKDLVNQQVQKNKIVLFSSHQMSYVEEFCEDICIINHGKIILDGNLRNIKRQYPKNKIRIRAEEDTKQLVQKLQSIESLKNEILSLEWDDGSAIITLKDEKNRKQLLHATNELNVTIDLFAVEEPTLEEIFVEKAGDCHETM